MAENSIIYKGQLKGHSDWVTSIATSEANPDRLVSCSRDKTVIVWELTRSQTSFGFPKKALRGHSHFVSDVVLSSDGNYALSGSWDKTLRLWDLESGACRSVFQGHTKDVLSVAFSPDNRQIVSASRDHSIKLWNTLGECKYTLGANEQGHSDWASCVRFSPSQKVPVIVSAGWDRVVKVWNLQTCKLSTNLVGHQGFISSVTISPDGSLCASAGKDSTAMLWDLTKGEHLYSLTLQEPVNALAFSPNRFWLCAATDKAINIFDLETKAIIAQLMSEKINDQTKKTAACISLAWSADGSTLFGGYSDGRIRVFGI